jgi:hypothetical protein
MISSLFGCVFKITLRIGQALSSKKRILNTGEAGHSKMRSFADEHPLVLRCTFLWYDTVEAKVHGHGQIIGQESCHVPSGNLT